MMFKDSRSNKLVFILRVCFLNFLSLFKRFRTLGWTFKVFFFGALLNLCQ